MDLCQSFSAEITEDGPIHPSHPYGTVRLYHTLLLDKWQMTACLKFSKWYLMDNSVRNKDSPVTGDNNSLP